MGHYDENDNRRLVLDPANLYPVIDDPPANLPQITVSTTHHAIGEGTVQPRVEEDYHRAGGHIRDEVTVEDYDRGLGREDNPKGSSASLGSRLKRVPSLASLRSRASQKVGGLLNNQHRPV